MSVITAFPRYKRKKYTDGPYHIKWEDIEPSLYQMSLDEFPDEVGDGDTLVKGFFQLPFTMDLSDSVLPEDARAGTIPCIAFLSDKNLLKLIPLKKIMPYLECFRD